MISRYNTQYTKGIVSPNGPPAPVPERGCCSSGFREMVVRFPGPWWSCVELLTCHPALDVYIAASPQVLQPVHGTG